MSQAIMQRQTTKGPSAWEVTLANTKLWLKSPTPYLNALGLVPDDGIFPAALF